jgi:hypothetical protein
MAYPQAQYPPSPYGQPQGYAPPQYPPQAYAQPQYAQAPNVPGYPQPVPVAPQLPAAAMPTPVPSSTRPLPVPRPSPALPQASLPPAAAPTPVAPAPVVAPRPVAAPQAAASTTPIPANRPIPAGTKPIPVGAVEKKIIVAKEKDELDEEKKTDLLDEKVIVKKASPFLVSFIVHIVIIIILAFITFMRKESKVLEFEAVYAEELGEQLENQTLDTGFEDPMTTDAALAIADISVNDPLAAPPMLTDFQPNTVGVSSDVAAPVVGHALTGREAGAKKALLGAYGGTATTEASVKLGLEWLAKNQMKDGTWSLAGEYANPALNENVTSATAMALLAFQGAGHTTKEGEYQKVVEKGWNALLKMQDRDGNFVRDASVNQQLYAQAQATIAICELYAMTKESKYAGPAELAVKYALKSQSREGGWRYSPNVDTDTSVTGWFVMGLQSAKMAGIPVPQESLDNVSKWLDYVGVDEGAMYRYQRQKPHDPTMTAEGLLCRQYLGWKRNDPAMQKGVKYVLAHPLSYDQQNVYYWYYATQMLHHMEGEAWDEWNSVMRQAIPTQQVKTGKEKGSWDPVNDEWGHHGGRLYVTCLSIYMLEVYYRHLPIYSNHEFR